MITGLTIGAGVLGLPYVVAQTGLVLGLIEIVALGLVMLLLNVMIGEIAVQIGRPAQLSGFAAEYLGTAAKDILSFILIFRNCGVLLAYVIAAGAAVQALIGGVADWWSIVFWLVGSLCVAAGMERLKTIEKLLSLAVIGLLVGASVYALGFFQSQVLTVFHPGNTLLAYGVILFALHASAAIPEAHELLPSDPLGFRRAIVWGTLIPVIVYLLFSLGVVGVLGSTTSQLASVALGQKFGPVMALIVNMAAVFAMITGFMGLATAFKETLVWDHQWPVKRALFLVLGVPLVLFLGGARNFIMILNVVGGLFISIESLILVAVYWRANRRPGRKHNFRWLTLALPVLGVFSFFAVVTVVELVKKFW